MQQETFGSRIKKLRQKSGFTQRSLAEKIGIDFTYLSKIENGVLPPPSTEVIEKLASFLNTDKDEMLSLAGKVPSDIAELLKDRHVMHSLRGGNEISSELLKAPANFGARLKELRESAGFSQSELAGKLEISFTYLSKIENGVKPPPSERVISRLVDVLGCDKDELMALAGKVPSDIARMLRSSEVRQSLRDNYANKRFVKNGSLIKEGVGIMKHLMNGKTLVRVGLAVVLVAATAVSLWFSTPSSDVRALKIDLTNASGQPLDAGTVGQTYNFKVTVTVESGERMPIGGADISIVDVATHTRMANLINLPYTNGAVKSFTSEQTGGGAADVTVSTDLTVSSTKQVGYVVWNGSAYNFPAGYYYGGAGGNAGTLTFNVAWTPPAGWPAGTYEVVGGIAGGGQMFAKTGSFSLQTGLLAETGASQWSAGINDIVVVNAIINRIKNPADNVTASIPGGIGSYAAMVTNPGGGIQFLGVNGVAPYNSPNWDTGTGVYYAASAAPEQPNNTTVARIVAILTGSSATTVTLNNSFQAISANQTGVNVPEETSNTLTFRRGDVKNDDGVVDINDALFIAQYIVGQKTFGQIGGLNAASVKHDGTGGDVIDINDALYIAQFIVGQKNASFQ